MPNWAINLLTITGAPDRITACLEAIKADKPDIYGSPRFICFEKILPMPAILRNIAGGHRAFENTPDEKAICPFHVLPLWFVDGDLEDSKARSESARPLSESEKAELDKTGATDSRDWAITNWGCKWDATETNLEGSIDNGEVYIRFETPWSPPTPILRALREQYPDLVFTMRYRLEDDPEYPHDADEF
jgi:hypothetical protein